MSLINDDEILDYNEDDAQFLADADRGDEDHDPGTTEMETEVEGEAIPTRVSGDDSKPAGNGGPPGDAGATPMEEDVPDEAAVRPKRKKRSEMTQEEKKVPPEITKHIEIIL